MTSVLICTVDTTPCPPESVQTMSVAEAFSPDALGITAETITHAYSWGFASVLLFFFIGYGVAVAKGLISKL